MVREVRGTENCKEQHIVIGNSSSDGESWEAEELIPLATESAVAVIEKGKMTSV